MPGMFPMNHLPQEQIDSATPDPSPPNGSEVKIRDLGWVFFSLGMINGGGSAESEGENGNYSLLS